MRCIEVHNLLSELARDELSLAAEGLVRTHVDGCVACGAVLGREQRLLASLRAMPVPAMPDGYAARALRFAREAESDSPVSLQDLQRFGRVFAVAASVLVVCGLGFVLTRSVTPMAMQEVAVQLPLGTSQMVALKIDAPQAFDNVQFAVTLPANVALQDQPDLREFAWSGQLQAGVNVLSLPLVGILPAGGHLLATVKYGTTVKSLKIPLTVSQSGVHSAQS